MAAYPPLNFRRSFQDTVSPDQCDNLGHLNVQYYVAAVNGGAAEMMGWIGLSPPEIQQRRMGFAVVRMETDFLAEVRRGEAYRIESAFEALGGKTITIWHRMVLDGSGREAMVVKVVAALLHLDDRKAVPIPEDIRARVRGHIA